MAKNRHRNIWILVTSTFMSVLLVWLSVSLPFVYEAKQSVAEKSIDGSKKTHNDCPFSGVSDEKAPSNPTVNITEEYLHHADYVLPIPNLQISNAYIHAHESTYIAYHGELLCPPPNPFV